MKKLSILAVAVIFTLGLTSCKKDYTCTCTVGGVSSATEIKDAKKSDAKDACDALSALSAIGGGSCSLD